MKEKLMRFMQGRYGADQLSRFMMWVTVGLIIINLFFRSWILNAIILTIIILTYMRMLSKKSDKRYSENMLYLKAENKVRGVFKKLFPKTDINSRYLVFKCPDCRQKLRVPKGKGKITVTCAKCSRQFTKRT